MDTTNSRYVVEWTLTAETEILASTPEEAHRLILARIAQIILVNRDTKYTHIDINAAIPQEADE